MTKFIATALPLTLLLLSLSPAVRGADPLETRFHAEYPEAAAKLEAAASKMKCVAAFKMEGTGGFKSSLIERTTYMNGKNQLVVEDFKINRDVPAANTVVYGLNADSFFQLERPAPGVPFMVTNLSKVSNIQEKELYLKMLAHCYLLTDGATTIGGVPLKAVMSHPTFKITKIMRKEAEGSRCEIAFTCDDPTHWIVGGTVGVDPLLGWALTGYDVEVSGDRSVMTKGMPKGTRYKGSVRCRDWGAGRIFPEEISFRFSYLREPNGPEPLKRLNVQSYEYADIADSQFRPSAFGVQDIVLTPRAEGFFTTHRLLLGAFVVCMVSAIVLWYIQSRRSANGSGRAAGGSC